MGRSKQNKNKRKRRRSTGSKSPAQLAAKQAAAARSRLNDATRAKVVAKRTAASNMSELNLDVLREVASKLRATPTIHRVCKLNKSCEKVAYNELSKAVGKGRVIDVARVANNKNPLISRFYDCERKGDAVAFHNDVRKLMDQLEGMDKSSDDSLVNLNVNSLGWFFDYADTEIRRCPALLQKRIAALLKNHFQRTEHVVYCKSFLRPSRFLKTFMHRPQTITKLDLGNMPALRCLELEVNLFPHLENLSEFTWHRAELWFVQALPSPHRLRRLCLTMRQGQIDAETLRVLLNCQGLDSIYTGFPIPHHPTRFDLDVLLRSYQAFWNQRQYVPEDIMTEKGIEPVPLSQQDHTADFALCAFPRLDHAAFWNAPEYLFVIMTKLSVRLDTLQFGVLDQQLSRLCSLDSLMQALFKFNQPKYDMEQLAVKNLKLFVHAMPVVTLDYYLPQLMNGVGQCLSAIQSLDLFVHFAFDASMASSWSLEGRKKGAGQPKLENLTSFSLHADGHCVLDDLDVHLPPSLNRLSLSFICLPENRRSFLSSLMRFVKHLADINRFPDLEHLTIQVSGIRCFEPILNCIVDQLSGLRTLAVLCMPVTENRDSLLSLIDNCSLKCDKLTSFSLCASMVKLLIKKETASPTRTSTASPTNWRLAISLLRLEMPSIRDTVSIQVASIPECNNGWDSYVVKPEYGPLIDVDDSVLEELDTSSSNTDDSGEDDDEEEMKSFIADDVIDDDESEDELEEAERRLETESKRRDNRWAKKSRARVDSSCSEEPSEREVVVFRKKKRRGAEGVESSDDEMEEEEEVEQNPFLDDEAVESDCGDSDGGEPEEVEGENIEGSDDEDMIMAAAEMVNARPRAPPPKRKKIVVSDSD